MTREELQERALDIAASEDFGRASAMKCGRNPAWPYVPIRIVRRRGGEGTEQILGRAFKSREEAVADAEKYIVALRLSLQRRLLEPRYRALREHHGLPREIA